MKVGIVTLNGYHNYGNRLQNYALQEALKSLGHDVETLVIKPPPPSQNGKCKQVWGICRFLLETTPADLVAKIRLRVWKQMAKASVEQLSIERLESFRTFNVDHIRETDFHISEENVPSDISDRYDCFIAGSDQIWNPIYTFGSPIYFLSFAEAHKRVAYAASFGVTEIDDNVSQEFGELLMGMFRISVREAQGAKIVNKLTGQDVPVLVDPTLLLSREQWLSISRKHPVGPFSKYLLTYFLDGLPKKYQKQIDAIAIANNLEIVNLADIKSPEMYKVGPLEFLDLINRSSLFCTNSFHGVVFSLLFKRPFIVFERKTSYGSMFSRIDTLLRTFGLESRKNDHMDPKHIFKVDYSHTDSILRDERAKAFDFLESSLKASTEALSV